MKRNQLSILIAVLLTVSCGKPPNQSQTTTPDTQVANLSGYWNLTLQTTKYKVTQSFAVLIAPFAVSNRYTLEFLALPTPYSQPNLQPLYWCAPVNVEPLDGLVTSSGSGVNFQLVGFQNDAFNFSGNVNGNSISGSFTDNGGGCTNGDTATWQANKTSADMNLAGMWQFTSNSKTLNAVTVGSGTVQQNGTAVTGALTISGTPCAISIPLSGVVTGTHFTGQETEGNQAVTLTGEVYGNGSEFTSPTGSLTITGTYSSPSGGCLNGDQGTWSATKS